METTGNVLEDLIDHVEKFGKTTFELSKLRSVETTSTLVPMVLSKICVVAVFSFFVFVLNIGIAIYLGDLIGNGYIGFFIVSGFYLLVGIIFYFFLHGWIKKPLAELIIKQILK